MAKPKQEPVEVASDAPVTPAGSRKARWEAFLEGARAQRPDPAIFDEQRERGEFDNIPDTFI